MKAGIRSNRDRYVDRDPLVKRGFLFVRGEYSLPVVFSETNAEVISHAIFVDNVFCWSYGCQYLM